MTRAAVDAVHASLLPSACPDAELATPARTDPYWDRLWAPGSQAHWANRALLEQRKAASPTSVSSRYLLGQEQALGEVCSVRGWRGRLAFWGVLDSYRTATAEQVAAFAGDRSLLRTDTAATAGSISLGLVDVGSFPAPLADRATLGRGAVYRPSNTDVFDEVIAPLLTWPEWVAVTAGYPWNSGSQFDRHNILAAELALRAAEYLPQIGAVLGEKLSTVDLYAGTGIGKEVAAADNRRADGTLVRDDGLRIAVEITATSSKALERKMHRWAELIQERPLETSGLVVLFVAAPHPDRPKGTRTDPRHELYRRLAKVLEAFPGTGEDSPAARIGIVSWDEWFPARHELSEDFFSLAADFALGDPGPGRWVRRPILELPFEPWHGFDATAVIANSKLLAATPHWMRKGDHTHLIGSPFKRAGQRLPVPAPRQPERVKGHKVGAAKGAAGAVKLPDRLRLWA